MRKQYQSENDKNPKCQNHVTEPAAKSPLLFEDDVISDTSSDTIITGLPTDLSVNFFDENSENNLPVDNNSSVINCFFQNTEPACSTSISQSEEFIINLIKYNPPLEIKSFDNEVEELLKEADALLRN